MEKHIKELFVFVAQPEVPPDNNAAERSRRHLVVSRKVSGGTRSEQGTDTKMTLASIFGTWRAQAQPHRCLPSTAHFPSTLNCYGKTYQWSGGMLTTWVMPMGILVSMSATKRVCDT